jgi:hypothetical protein
MYEKGNSTLFSHILLFRRAERENTLGAESYGSMQICRHIIPNDRNVLGSIPFKTTNLKNT